MPRSLRPRVITDPKDPVPRETTPRPQIAASVESSAARETPRAASLRIVPGELVGSDFATVREVLREPDDVQSGALTVVWTYSESSCILRLFFYPDIQTRIFHLLKYNVKSTSGEKLNDSSLCMQQLAAARKDESEEP